MQNRKQWLARTVGLTIIVTACLATLFNQHVSSHTLPIQYANSLSPQTITDIENLLYPQLTWSEVGPQFEVINIGNSQEVILSGTTYQSNVLSNKPTANLVDYYSHERLAQDGWQHVNDLFGMLLIFDTYFKAPNRYLTVGIIGHQDPMLSQRFQIPTANEYHVRVWISSPGETAPTPIPAPTPMIPKEPIASSSITHQNPLPVPGFSQNDNDWKKDRQGWCDENYPSACDYSTLGYVDTDHTGYGCWTTSYSMLYNYYKSNHTTPKDLNNKLNSTPEPRYAGGNNNHCNNRMPPYSPYAPSGVTRGDDHYNVCAEVNCIDEANEKIIQDEIDAGRPLLAFVHFSGSLPQHMIVIVGYSGDTYYIKDPYDGGLRTLETGGLGPYVVDRIYEWSGTPPGCTDVAPVGDNSSRQQMFIDAYKRNNGETNLGCTEGTVYWWGNENTMRVTRQDFTVSDTFGDAVIVHDEDRDDPLGTVRAYVVHGGILGNYLEAGNLVNYGPATSDEFTNQQGLPQSNFANGYVTWEGGAVWHTWPTSFSQWKAEYYNNTELIGYRTMVRNENIAKPDYNWGEGAPEGGHIGVLEDKFSVRWTRTLNFDAGTYRFSTHSDDGVRVWVDNTKIIDHWQDGGDQNYTGDITLSGGNHTVKIEYYENGDLASFDIDWFLADTTPPAINFGTPIENRWYNTNQTLSWSITDDRSGVRGYKVAWNQNPPGGNEVPSSSGSTTLSAAGQGQHALYVQAWDNAGNASLASASWFGYDTTPPTKASNVRPDGWTDPYTGDTTPRFAWNPASDVDSGIDGYYVAVDDWTPEGGSGNDWWVGNITAYTVPDPLPEGEHIFAVTSKDNAGNVNPTNTNTQGDAPYYTFYVDIAPPSTPQLAVSGSGCSGIQNNGWQNTCNTPAFSWSANDSVSGIKDYRYYWGASASGTPDTVTTNTTFAPGAIAPADGYASIYLNVTARDQLDHESGRASFGVRYDGTTPTVTLRINDDAATTNQVSVWLDLAASDTGSGVSEMRFSDNNLVWSDWEPYAEIKSWTLPALDRRTHTIYVQVRDRAGNESSVASDSITLDLYPPMPHSASYRICDDVVNVGGTVGLTSISYALVSSIGQPWATGAAANSSAAFVERAGFLAAADGCRPISRTVTSNYTITQWVVASGGNLRGSTSYRLGDTAGQPSASGHSAFTSTSYVLSSGFWAQITGTVPPTSTIQPTPVPPTPTLVPMPGPTPTPQPGGFGVSINDGVPYTNDTNVIVSAWAPNVTHLRLNNDDAYADEGWMTYQITRTWVLSTYGDYVMPRYVYAWFKDEQSTVYGPYPDGIIYDPIPPQGNVTILDSTATTMTLGLEAQDDNSGIAQMRVGETTLANATWQPYTTTITWTLPSSAVYVQFNDRAGNESPLYGSDSSEHWLESGPVSVMLDGPTLGITGTAHTFTANALPVTVTLPITYIWQATGYEPITRANTMRGSDVLSFTWDVTGTKTITVTALNSLGIATGTYNITLLGTTPSCPRPLTDVGIQWFYQDTTLYIDTLYAFQAIITPTDATPIITYTWSPSPEYGQGTPYSSYQWSTPSTYTITLTAQNCGGILLKAQHVVTIQDRQYLIDLPLILRN